MDKLSAKSLQAVGDVAVGGAAGIQKRLSSRRLDKLRGFPPPSAPTPTPFACAKIAVDDVGSAARPRFSSQKTTFDLPDIGPISISWLRPTIAGGHAGVDRIDQLVIALAERLDHRRGVDTGRGPERVAADHGIVGGIGTPVAAETVSQYSTSADRSRSM